MDAGPGRIEAEVRFFIRNPPYVVQPFELDPIGGERPPAVRRNTRDHALERNVQPD